MTPESNHVQKILYQLYELTSNDVVALGIILPQTQKIRWQYIYGGISPRTEKIRQKLNSKLTGEAIRIGRPIVVHSESDQAKFSMNESIILTEQLNKAIAVPLLRNIGQYQGVIVIGNRNMKMLNLEPAEQIESLIGQLNTVLSQDTLIKA